MTIITSQPPYRDDFDKDKGYYRVLYRPGYPVQARELTQQQTALQYQIEKFGRHIFDEGSLVTGGQFNIDLDFPYVLLSPENQVGNYTNPTGFEGKTIQGAISGVKARVLKVDQVTRSGVVYYAAFIRYLSGSATTDATAFTPGETAFDVDNIITTIKIRQETFGAVSVLGKGSLFTIEEGVVFSHGMFVDFGRQSVILDPFSTSPSCRVGFEINIEVISSTDDETLLDNANGTPNYNAPGADRLKITATLKTITLDDTESLPSFVETFTIKDGVVQTKYERPQYAVIGDEIAKRTYDESGDYTIRGHGIRTREHLDTGENEGYLTAAAGGDSSLLCIDVEPGLSYVKGYEIETLVTQHISTPKSSAYSYVNSQIISARSSNYVVVEEIVGIPVLDKGTQIQLYCSGGASPDIGEKRITNVIPSSTLPTGNLIGTARVKSVTYESGTLGTASGRLRIYLYDIQMNSTCGGIPNVRGIYCSTPVHFFADVVLNGITGSTELQQKHADPLLYPIGTNFTRTIRSDNDLSDTSFTFQRTNESITIGSDGTFDVSIITSGEQFAYGEGQLSSAEKLNIFVTLTENAAISLPGTVSGSIGQKTLTGVNTYFTRLNVGDKIEIADVAETFIISSISNNNSLIVDKTFSGNFSTKTYEKVYYVGDFIDLNSKGSDAGLTRTASVDVSRKSLAINLKETFGDTISATVSYLASRSSALEIKKLLYTNRFVKIDCSSVGSDSPPDLTLPINLGISDVFKIHQIRKSSDPFTSSTQGTDVTDEFTFDNGQRDDFYDHAKIQLRQGFSLTASDYLLIELDYFDPDFTQGVGYFSVDSYPIDDTKVTSTTIFTHEIPLYKSPETGRTYNLRDYLDFRSVKQNTAVNSSTVAGASINPAVSSEFKKAANGLRLAFPSSSIYIDYSYYLARRDIVVATINKTFEVIQGTSAVFPTTPSIPESVMGLAELYIPPYPSISGSYGRILGRTDISVQVKNVTFERHTMRDIGVLKNRIANLEYYTTLSLLEKSVQDLKVLDENGLDRFKNGYFVDNFEDHSLGESESDDYRIAVDSKEQCIRPYFEMDSFKYQFLPEQSVNVQIGESLITLPYTEVSFIEQLKATSYRNIEQSVFRYIGNVTMKPDTDVWVDTDTVDKTIQQDFSIDKSFFGTTWGSWSEYVSGYNVYQQAGGWTGLKFVAGSLNETAAYKGSFNSLAEAEAAAKKYALYGNYYPGSQYGTQSNGVVETYSQQSRQGIKTSGTDKTTTSTLGSFVTNASLATYIRPQTITVHAKGLKANTRYHCFFDEENMNEYVIPYTIPDGWNGNLNSFIFPVVKPNSPKTMGLPLKTDAYGDLVFHLVLPSTGKRFRVGTKEVKVTDSPTNAIDATSYAVGYFVSHGLIQQKQNTILSTKHTVVQTESVQEVRKTQSVKVVGPSCMAYSFFVNAEEPGTKEIQDGIFLTSVDVWIQSIDTTNKLGVWFEIREMNSAGGITRTQVPYSEVWMKWNDPRIKVSDDASEYTRVNFENPVFLLHNTQYAFIIHTEGLNPNTYFWVSRIGETDIVTGQQVTGRQLTGNVYTTNNNLNWDIVPDIDLKVRFNRAKFQKGTGLAMFGNEATEMFVVRDRSSVFVQYGEKIRGSDKLSLINITGTETIEIGDVLTGGTSGIIAEVLNISGGKYFVAGSGFEADETITVESGSPLSVKDITATVSLVEYGLGTLVSFNRRNNKMTISDSNGHFFAGSEIIGINSAVTATIDENERLFLYDFSERGVVKVGDEVYGTSSGKTGIVTAISGSIFTVNTTGFEVGETVNFDGVSPDITAKILRIMNGIEDFGYSTLHFNPNNLIFTNTDIRYELKEIVTSSDAMSSFKEVLAKTDVTFDTQRSLLSRTNEILRQSGAKSAQARCNMTSNSELVSPVIDMNRTNGVYVYNTINDDITNETNPTGGYLFNKYISKIVTLAEGQDAEDLLVSLTAYVPPGITDDYPIRVWAKILNNQDGELFSEKSWIEMNRVGEVAVFSSEKNINDYKSIDFRFPDSMISNDEIRPGVQYVANGNTYTGFKQFAVKIGLLGNEGDTAIVPKVADLRVIALQM